MRRQTPIAHVLYNHLYPNPSTNDPSSFSAHLARNLVPEVRVEVATFYGDLNSAEARYPGLNYCHPPHRMRLGRFKHHRRLFEAFDSLGLTCNEIQDFCCWEGTKWARERYEKDEGVKVIDTTGDEIGPYVDRRRMLDGDDDRRRCSITRKTDISVVVEDADAPTTSATQPSRDEEMTDGGPRNINVLDTDSTDEHEVDEEDEDEFTGRIASRSSQARHSTRRNHYHTVTQQLLAAWNEGQELPPEIEQFLKDQSDHGITVGPSHIAQLSELLAARDATARRRSRSTALTAPPRTSTASA